LHLGPKWKGENNDWIRRTFDTVMQEFTDDEIRAVARAFPLARETVTTITRGLP